MRTQPSGQTCTVSNGGGTVAAANVTNIFVACGASPPPGAFSIGGTVSGLAGTVVLRNNGGDDLTLSANGGFRFATLLASGGTYAVTVFTQPSGQTCTVVSNGRGTVATANVINAAVACTATVADALFLYTANSDSDSVTTFSIHPATGVLTEVGTPVAVGGFPRSVTVDPTGRFAYVANAGSDNVTIFRIAPATGVLSAWGAVLAGNSPQSIAVLGGSR